MAWAAEPSVAPATTGNATVLASSSVTPLTGKKTLPLSIQGRSATVSYDGELVWLHRSGSWQPQSLRKKNGQDENGTLRHSTSKGTSAEHLWLDDACDGRNQSSLTRSGSSKGHDPSSAYLCVPHALVLHSSFIPDSDGGSLLLRLLAPPTGTPRSPLAPWKVPKSRAKRLVETRTELDAKGVKGPAERLAAYLQGPCSNLRLVKIEARINDVAFAEDAADWAAQLMASAYAGVKPYRKLRVLVNPIGGPGKASQIFRGRVMPILEAAGCTVDATLTTHSEHGVELARELDLAAGYDAIVCVSGDGMLHEVLNGLAQRKNASEALAIPLVPIPAGSGNAVALNLLGVEQGFNLALACLNVIKGKAMDVDVCCVTQPADAKTTASARTKPTRLRSNRGKRATSSSDDMQSRSSTSADTAPSHNVANAATSPIEVTDTPPQASKPYSVSYSFLSQAIGLMADVDLGTEDMRALGDTRFVIGYITGVLSNRPCEADIYVKLGPEGTLEKSVMRQRNKSIAEAVQHGTAPAAKRDGEPENLDNDGVLRPTLKNGPVTDSLPSTGDGEDNQPQLLIPQDPSWSHSLLPKPRTEQHISPSQWYKLEAPISALYAGKIPFVSRDLLQFPFAQPADGCVDVALQLQDGGRAAKLRAISGAETGIVVYDPAVVYLKCEAYRVVPHLAAGNKRLKKGGLVSIDGESKPYRPFQVEVDGRIKMRFLSLFGKWQAPDVPPPSMGPR